MNNAQAAMLAQLQIAYGGDAIFRPSNADRWLGSDGNPPCPGSVQLIGRLPRVPQRPSQAARQGSGAHKLAEMVLLDPTGPTPEDFVGRSVFINDDPSDTIFVDAEMGEKITEYVAHAEAYRAIPGTELFIEHRLTLGALNPAVPLLRECRGTGDVVAVNRTERWIEILDLKYGVGVPVSGNSPQVKIYLLLAFLGFFDGKPWKRGKTIIFQPRLPVPPYTEDDHYKAFAFDPVEILTDFVGTVLEAMYAALEPNPKLTPTLKNCRWCEARPICPALQEAALSMAKSEWDQPKPTVHSLMSRMPPVPAVLLADRGQAKALALVAPSAIILKPVDEYDPAELSEIRKKIDLFEIWAASVDHRIAQLIQSGVKVPDWYMKERTGNRRWKLSREETEKALLELKLKPTDIYTDPALRSPAQIEKRLPKLLQGAISDLVERPPGAPTLVRGSDPDQKKALRPLLDIVHINLTESA